MCHPDLPGTFFERRLGCADPAGVENNRVCLGALRDVELQFAGSTVLLVTQISVTTALFKVLLILPVEDQLHAFLLRNVVDVSRISCKRRYAPSQ